jgi:glycogen debranching enzyme
MRARRFPRLAPPAVRPGTGRTGLVAHEQRDRWPVTAHPPPPAAAHPPPPSAAHQQRQPWLHELATSVHGNVTALSDAGGDMSATSAQGLYVDDRRAVSSLAVTVGGERPSPVSHAALGTKSEFLGSVRGLGSVTPDPVVEVQRHRELVDTGLRETVTVACRGASAVSSELVFRLTSDGAPISAIKSGLFDSPALVPAVTGDGGTFAAQWHDYRVSFEPAPTSVSVVDSAVVARFTVTVPPDGSFATTMSVTSARRRSSLFDADPGADRVRWDDVRVEATDPRLAPTVSDSLTDLRALLLTDPRCPGDAFAGAGTPWYLTLFGRDSIWAARLTLPIGTELAGGTLRALARRQGTRHDAQSGQAPGKIPHEVRRFAYLDRRTGMSLPPVYYGTVDATALWVTLLHDAWAWGMPEAEVRSLLAPLEAAVGWLTTDAVPDEDRLLKYHDSTGTGLSNQGWKDSADAIRFRDGSVAETPIALIEAQAYAVQALHCAARLLDAFGYPGARGARAHAAALRERVHARYWVDGPDGRYLGMAVDGHGRLVDGLGSNMAHVLGTGVLDPHQAKQVAATLTGTELLDEYGLRTYGTGNTGFNPLGYHTGSIWTHDTAVAALGLSQEGCVEDAVLLARALLHAAEAFDYRWPELYSGRATLRRPAPYPAACRPQAWSAASAVALVSVALGLRPDAAGRTLHVHPVRPAPYGAMRVEGLRFLGGRVDLDMDHSGTVTVRSAPERVTVRVH